MTEITPTPPEAVNTPVCVTSNETLQQLCERWRGRPALFLDTEFIRVDTFYPELGLLQVCDGEESHLLDPLELTDWAAFRELLADPGIRKVMHAASEDLLVFKEYFDLIPGPLFDTQKAAAFLDMGYSISYQNLVGELLDIELDKGATRTDWLQRPLTDSQLRYAVLDVAYLPALHEQLAENLERRGFLDALLEEGEQMRELARQIEDESEWDTLYLQMGAAWRLDREQLAVLRSLSRWREQEARRLNTPRTWVARDSDLIELARVAPADRDGLRAIPDLGRGVRRTAPDQWLKLIRQGRDNPIPDDAVPSGQPLSPAQRRQLKQMQKTVRELAGEQGMASEMLARKKQLISLLQSPDGWPDELRGWRQSLLEPALGPLRTASASSGKEESDE